MKTKRITDADILEMRRLYANKRMSYREIAKQFQCHHSTIARCIKTCDPVSPFPNKNQTKTRARKATKSDTLSLPQDKPRTKALIAGAKNEAQAIMQELDTLYRDESSRLKALQRCESEYKKKLSVKELRNMVAIRIYKTDGVTGYDNLPPKGKALVDALLPKYKFEELYKLYSKMSSAMIGMKATLDQMDRCARGLATINIDARRQTVNVIVDAESVIRNFLRLVVHPALSDTLPPSLYKSVAGRMDAHYTDTKAMILAKAAGAEEEREQ